MKPIQHHKDPRISNISLENFTGTVYVIDRNFQDENQSETMLTSSQNPTTDNFLPSHHLALITQPVLGARSRKKGNQILLQTPTQEKFDATNHQRRNSSNHSPSLISPINRMDPPQFQKKTSFNQHESADSGVDLSLSANSSVQLQPYSQQHISIHRPLSALNEDSSPDDGYHDEHLQIPSNPPQRLRFPPVHFGRNRSMEDMISNNRGGEPQQQQHRSSSFSDERQQKIARMYDGTPQDLIDYTSQTSDSSRRINKTELLYLPVTQQHRSLNDLTNKTSTKLFPSSRNESNPSSMNNHVTVTRKINPSTVKPVRKKTKLNILNEPSSRLAIYEEQINTTSSSSNQTTPRSTHPHAQQQIRSKPSTTLSHYSNQEQIRAHVNRSVVERQHLPPPPPRRGLIQQMIPFDASPSKVNNLLRHHHQQNQPAILFYPNSTSRTMKQTLPVLHNEDIVANPQGRERKRTKQKEQFDQLKFNEHQQKETSLERNLRKKTDKHRFMEEDPSISRQQQQQTSINQRYGSGHSISTTTGKPSDQNKQRNIPATNIYRSDGELIKPTKTNPYKEKRSSRMSDISNQYGSDYSHRPQRNILIDAQTRSTRTSEIPTIDPTQRKIPPQKAILSQGKSTGNSNRSDPRRERETSRLSNLSKTDSIPINDQPIKAKILKPKSPTTSSIISQRQTQPQTDLTNKTHLFQPELSISSSSHDELIEGNVDTPSRTYRLKSNEQPLDGRHVIPSNTLPSSSMNDQISHSSSADTHPFSYTPESEINDENRSHLNEKKKSNPPDIYVLSDDDDDHDDHDDHHHYGSGPSPLVHLSKTKKKYSSPPPPPPPQPISTKKVNLSEDKIEIVSNYDSDDGWSDDSAELLYVDERYAKDKGKSIPNSHLASQKSRRYPIQQQNVLLQ